MVSSGEGKLTLASLQGVMKLVDAAGKAGAKKFVLQTSILTNGKAKGEGLNPVFLLLNGITGALDKKLEVKLLGLAHLRPVIEIEMAPMLGLTTQPCSAV